MGTVLPNDPAVETHRTVVRTVVVPTTRAPGTVVEKKRSRRRLPVATILNFGGGPDRDHRRGGTTAATTDGPRDGSARAGEISVMTIQDAIIE